MLCIQCSSLLYNLSSRPNISTLMVQQGYILSLVNLLTLYLNNVSNTINKLLNAVVKLLRKICRDDIEVKQEVVRISLSELVMSETMTVTYQKQAESIYNKVDTKSTCAVLILLNIMAKAHDKELILQILLCMRNLVYKSDDVKGKVATMTLSALATFFMKRLPTKQIQEQNVSL